MHIQQAKTMLGLDADSLRTLPNESIDDLLKTSLEYINTLEQNIKDFAQKPQPLILG